MDQKEKLALELWGNIKIRHEKDLHTLVSELGRKNEALKDKASELSGMFLVHGNPVIRHAALVSIMELGCVDTHFDQIIQMLEDQTAMVREAAAVAMARTGLDSKNILLKLLESPEVELRFQAPISLVEKNYEDTAGAILDRLSKEGDTEVKVNLLIALGDFKYTPALEEVIKISEQNPFEIVRFEAAYTAARLGDTSRSEMLVKYMTHSVYGESAVSALELISSKIENNNALIKSITSQYNKFVITTEKKLLIGGLCVRLGYDSPLNWIKARTSSLIFQTRVQALTSLGRTANKDAADFLSRKINEIPEKRRQEKEVAADSLITLCKDLNSKNMDTSGYINVLEKIASSTGFDAEIMEEIKLLRN